MSLALLLYLLPSLLPTSSGAWLTTPPLSSFHWELSGNSNYPSTSDPAAVYDIDGFETSAATIQKLKKRGTQVMCYFSFGTVENWRPDYSSFPKAAIGGMVCNEQDNNGKCVSYWPGERWLDVKSAVVRQILKKRIQLAASKGCSGIEPDNTDAWSNNINIKPVTKITVSKADQLNFNKWIANTCHKYGLSVGLKNPDELVTSLAPLFDWALVEQCNEYTDWSSGDWYAGKFQCDFALPFIAQNKMVAVAVYDKPDGISWPQTLCKYNNANGFSTRRYTADVSSTYYGAFDCLKHRPASCQPWKQCVQPAVYKRYNVHGSGMQDRDMMGQCIRANMKACAYV